MIKIRLFKDTEKSLLESGDGKVLQDMVASADAMDAKLSDHKNHNVTFWIAIAALVVAGLSIALLFFERAKMDIQISEIRSENSAKMTWLQKNQRGLVAGETAPSRVEVKVAEDSPRLGSKDAKVEIVEYSDFQCPYCHKFFTDAFQQIKTEYVDTGKASFVYQSFPFLGEESKRASEASFCAKDQGKFWEFHDILFNNQKGENKGTFSDKNLRKLAIKAGLDTKEFNACFDSAKYRQLVADEWSAGRDFGVSGTPTIFVNGYRLVGAQSFQTFKDTIEQALQE